MTPQRAGANVMRALAELRDALEKKYPRGHYVDFYVRHNQVTRSRGRVTHYEGFYVCVRMDTAAGATKRIHYTEIL